MNSLARFGAMLRRGIFRTWPHVQHLIEQIGAWALVRPRNFFVITVLVLVVLPVSRWWTIDTAFVVGIVFVAVNLALVAVGRKPWFPWPQRSRSNSTN